MKQPEQMKDMLEVYRLKQSKWQEEREFYLKTINVMQQEINHYHALYVSPKKSKHKRASSEEQTFIFNQTNISSYYPIVVIKSTNWAHKAKLRSHLDSVRTVFWHEAHLLTAGEDCTLKIWEKEQLKLTIREHLGPIYSICHIEDDIYTAGAEGVIRKWSKKRLLKNQTAELQGDFHEQPIWEIISNVNKQLLITSSSDQSHKIIKCAEDELIQKSSIYIENDTPTSIDWLSENKFISGFVNQNILKVYDLQTSKTVTEYCFEGKAPISLTNKIQSSMKQKMIATANQDHYIRFYDTNTNKKIKEIAAHSDSVTSILFMPESYELVSCGHDGNLRIWDLRKYKCVSDTAINMRKYDESAMCLSHSKEEAMLAIGGADGSIKLLHQQH